MTFAPAPSDRARQSSRTALATLGTIALAIGAAITLPACRDKGKESETQARAHVDKLAALVAKDVEEVERGLPEGAKKVVENLTKEIGKDGDPKQQVPAVRSALLKMRQQVPDLGIAKSTFFALADDKGIAIRNDFEHDTMAGKDLASAWPGLKPVLAGTAFASTTGQFPGAPNPLGPDKEWVAAVPVTKADKTPAGMLVTGWTYRRFAYHLQVALQRDLQDELMRTGDKGKMPILYVCLYDKDGVYCAGAPGAAPVPPVNEKALAGQDLHAKSASGTASGVVPIENREFGFAGGRLPKLGGEVGVAVLRSEI